MNEERKLKCKKCGKEFTELNDFVNHIQRHIWMFAEYVKSHPECFNKENAEDMAKCVLGYADYMNAGDGVICTENNIKELAEAIRKSDKARKALKR